MHKIHIRHLGPIIDCELEIGKFNVFTGPQSNGKSTIAKAIYYCRSIKQDILNIMMQGGPAKFSGNKTEKWIAAMQSRMKEKFLQIFGTSWIMPTDMTIQYFYKNEKTFIKVTLNEDAYTGRNYIDVNFSQDILDYFNELDNKVFLSMTVGNREYEERQLAKLFDDPYETVFIPAGRNLITLLSEQMNFIFTSFEESQLRNIDYVTKRYTELILKLKPLFSHGMEGYIREAKDVSERNKKYVNNRPLINLLLENMKDVLGGSYRYVDGEERLYIDDSKKYVKINFSSSGQQEIVWVLNLLFYYLMEDRKVFLILEEPESHLYPKSQQKVGEILSLFLSDEKNAELVTTHSPYLLGTFNYLLQANQTDPVVAEKIKKKLRKRYWLDHQSTKAYFVEKGKVENAISTEDGLVLIKNELIDGASNDINEMMDFILEEAFEAEANDD